MRPRSMQLLISALEVLRRHGVCLYALVLGRTGVPTSWTWGTSTSCGHCRWPTETPLDPGRPCGARGQTR